MFQYPRTWDDKTNVELKFALEFLKRFLPHFLSSIFCLILDRKEKGFENFFQNSGGALSHSPITLALPMNVQNKVH